MGVVVNKGFKSLEYLIMVHYFIKAQNNLVVRNYVFLKMNVK